MRWMMKQEEVAGKILVELSELEIVTEKDEWTVYNYLMQAYAAGYNEGKVQRNHRKRIAQYDKDGDLVRVHESQRAAANFVNANISNIRRALTGRTKTCKGFKWEYVNKVKPTSSDETIGTWQPEQ